MRNSLPCRSILVLIIGMLGSQETTAQADVNLASQLNEFVPRPDISPIRQEIEIRTERVPIYTWRDKPFTLTRSQRRKKFDQLPPAKKALFLPLSEMSDAQKDAAFDDAEIPRTETRRVREQTGVRTKTTKIAKPRTPEVKFVGAGYYSYETNASKNPSNIPDSIGVIVSNLSLKLPVGDDEDTLVFSGGTTSLRYRTLTNKSLDIATASATYATVFHKTAGPGGFTRDTLAFGLEASTVRNPTFGAPIVNLVTPSVAVARTNIPLGDELCGAKQDAYCYSASVTGTAKHTWADIATQEFATFRIATDLNWITPIAGLSVAGTIGAQTNIYTNFPGGREDFIYDIAGVATWLRDLGHGASVSLSGTVKFTHLMSSRPQVDWNGFMLSPRLTLTFKPPIM